MKILAITGMPLSGKGVLSDKLIEKGYKRVVMSDVVRAEMSKQQIPVTNENLRNFATDIRTNYGQGYVAKLCIPQLDKLKLEPVVIIDGVRSPEEVTVFKEAYGSDFILIAVQASLEIRFARLGRPDRASEDPVGLEQFKWRDEKELSWGLGDVLITADYTIQNEGAVVVFEQKIDEFLEKILP